MCVEMFVPDMTAAVVEAHRTRRARLRKKASRQVELSSHQLLQSLGSLDDDEHSEDGACAVHEAAAVVDENEWLKREKERRLKLEREVKSLNELYMGWIREEQKKRKRTEQQLAALMDRADANTRGATSVSKER